jgi:hypothetical protein
MKVHFATDQPLKITATSKNTIYLTTRYDQSSVLSANDSNNNKWQFEFRSSASQNLLGKKGLYCITLLFKKFKIRLTIIDFTILFYSTLY